MVQVWNLHTLPIQTTLIFFNVKSHSSTAARPRERGLSGIRHQRALSDIRGHYQASESIIRHQEDIIGGHYQASEYITRLQRALSDNDYQEMTTSSLYNSICKFPQSSSEFQAQIQPHKTRKVFQCFTCLSEGTILSTFLVTP